MIEYSVSAKTLSKKEKDLILDLAIYCERQLFKGKRKYLKLIESISIDVNDEAIISGETNIYMISQNKIYFEIHINSILNFRQLLLAITHEMIHVKQMTLKELVILDEKNVKSKTSKQEKEVIALWNGEKIIQTTSSKFGKNRVSYWNSPWEIEAYGRELGLLYQWIDMRDYRHKYNWADLSEYIPNYLH